MGPLEDKSLFIFWRSIQNRCHITAETADLDGDEFAITEKENYLVYTEDEEEINTNEDDRSGLIDASKLDKPILIVVPPDNNQFPLENNFQEDIDLDFIVEGDNGEFINNSPLTTDTNQMKDQPTTINTAAAIPKTTINNDIDESNIASNNTNKDMTETNNVNEVQPNTTTNIVTNQPEFPFFEIKTRIETTKPMTTNISDTPDVRNCDNFNKENVPESNVNLKNNISSLENNERINAIFSVTEEKKNHFPNNSLENKITPPKTNIEEQKQETPLTNVFAKNTKENVSTPFKKALFWPEPKTETKQKAKEKIPSVATSKEWKEYHKKKEEKKEQELKEKELTINERKRKQLEKEE